MGTVPAMGKYEQIAFDLLESAFGDRLVRDDSRIFSFGPGAGTGEVDGTIDGRIAVEIGVGSGKQVRASVLEVAMHPHPGKLILLVDTPGHSTERAVTQVATILERLGCSGVVFRVADGLDREEMARELAEVMEEYVGVKGKNMVWAVDGKSA